MFWSRKTLSTVVLAVLIVLPPGAAQAKGFRVLYSFSDGRDGGYPEAGLMKDRAGNLYGTTTAGGAHGYGVVFKLAPDGTETVLYSFAGGEKDGASPYGGLIMDKLGNLYGTTIAGGGSGCRYGDGCGTVFRVAPDGAETVLHIFAGGSDGGRPFAGLIKDKAGNLYGTTYAGGGGGCNGDGCGTVFKLAPDGAETLLHVFTDRDIAGAAPTAGLIEDKAGNFYGTTSGGGGIADTVFRLAPDGTVTVLHSFTGGSDGAYPYGGVIADGAGDLYGTTIYGGAYNNGVVFKLAPDGTETVLYSFTGGSDGASPYAGLIRDRVGNLYGTTYIGGASGSGAVFRVAPDGTETVLHSFTFSDGYDPAGGLIGRAGHLYGITSGGGARGDGVVFTLRK